LPPEQVPYTLKNGVVRLAVEEDREQYEKVKAGDADMEMVITMYLDDELKSADKYLTFSELEARGKQHPLENGEETWRTFNRDRLVTIIHTSGTTGKPKGAMLSHGNFLANLEAVQFWLIELLPEDVSLSYLPLSHVFERMA